MRNFIIVEVDSGLSVAEVPPEETPKEAAIELGGVVVDEGPYKSYDEALDAMYSLPDEEDGGERGAIVE